MKYGCVVIADIHQSMLEGIRGLMDSAFETTVMVASISSLREAAKKLEPDLVVMDISIPSSGELNVVKEFCLSCPVTKCIVLSVHDEEKVIDSVINLGARGFVFKRKAATDLLPAVDEVMGGGVYVSQY